jgi:glycosyltransferase involved in cell wall biosynthesis
MDNLSNPFVSVVIPVFNNPEGLKICLAALENQTYPKSLYEVIVVDNSSAESIESIINQFGQAVATYESRPGSYAARNKGISLAKGEVIAFTDSDCIPATDWIEKGVANLLHVPKCGLVAGKVDLFFKNPDKPTAVELYDSILLNHPQKEFIERERFGATANVFTFRSVIDNVGSFDDTLKSCADQEWGWRVFSFGYHQIYADDTCVAHPARYSLHELSKKIVRVIGGSHDLSRTRGYSFKKIFRDVTYALLPPIKSYFRVWSDKKLNSNGQKMQLLLVITYVKYLRTWERILLQMGSQSQRG